MMIEFFCFLIILPLLQILPQLETPDCLLNFMEVIIAQKEEVYRKLDKENNVHGPTSHVN